MAVTRCTARIVLALVVGAAAIVAGWERVSACSCVGPIPVCQAVWQTDAVFAGEVLAVTDEKQATTTNQTPVLQSGRHVRVRVLESFRGKAAKEVDVFTGSGGGNCGFTFQTGASYLNLCVPVIRRRGALSPASAAERRCSPMPRRT